MKRFYSILALAFTVSAMHAQSWTAPTLKLETEAVPEKAMLYHIGQEAFLTKGTTWGTHAALTKDAKKAFMYEFQLQQGTEGDYMLFSEQGITTKNPSGYTFRTGTPGADIYTDWKNGNGRLFAFTKNDNGYFTITSASSDPGYSKESDELNGTDYNTYKMGWNPNNDDVDDKGNSLGTNIGIFFLDPTLEGIQTDWAFVNEEASTLFTAQQALYNKLNQAVETGYTEEELAEYAAKLASENVEEVNAATETVSEMILNYAYNNATPDNPFDISEKIVNSTFEGSAGTKADGWVDEFDNMHIQNNKDYKLWNDATGTEMEEYGFQNFVQNWTSSNTDPIAESNIYQVLTDLPQGTYRLEAACIATSAAASLEVSGAELYAISGTIRYTTPIDKHAYGAEGSGSPKLYEVEITHFGGDLTIGLGFKPGYVKWFGGDNFKIYYCGPVDNPGLVALQAVLGTAQDLVDQYADIYMFSNSTKELLETELGTANDIASEADSEACSAEAEKLSALIATVQQEIKDYTVLKNLVDKVSADKETYKDVEDLGDQLAILFDTYNDAYTDGAASSEEIKAWHDGYDAMLKEGVKKAMATASKDKPLDVTIFAKNMNFANNSTTEGWNVEVGTVTDGGQYKVNNHNAEVWQNTFTASQTVENLPAGMYILKGKAFYRTSTTADGYQAYLNAEDKLADVLTYIFIGNVAAKIPNHAAGAVEATEAPAGGYVETSEGSGIWLPNSQAAAEHAFNNTDVYNTQVTGYLINDGALTFGLRNNEITEANNAWSIWTDLHLIYCGKSDEALYAQIENIKNQAIELQNGNAAAMIEKVANKLDEAIAAAENIAPDAGEEAILSVINLLNEAIAYNNAGQDLVDQIVEADGIYSTKLNEVESSDTAFPELQQTVTIAVADEHFLSNEQIQEWLEALPKAWTAYIQYDHLNATKDAPEDISLVITNRSFDEGENTQQGATGWTIDWENNGTAGHIGWNNTDQQAGSDYAYEYWKVNAIDLHQQIVGLAEGYYRLSVNGLYRGGNNDEAVIKAYEANPDSVAAMSVYANNRSVKMKNIYDEAVAEGEQTDGEVAVTLKGEQKYVPNNMIASGNTFKAGRYLNVVEVFVKQGEPLTIGIRMDGAPVDNNWCVFDNFKLEYLGNGKENQPDAVSTIEANINKGKTIYDLTGRRAQKAVKGLYIINGKKIIVQ